MASTQIIAVVLAALLAVGGAAASGVGPQALSGDMTETAVENVNAHAVADNGTVTVSVTDRGEPVQNVTVYAESDDEERVSSTDANGTVIFDLNASEELEIELEGENFEAELDYTVEDGSLMLLEEEYEYERDDIEDDEEDEEDEDEEDEEDEDEENEEDEDEEDEDEEDEEDEDEEDEEDEDEENEEDEDEEDEEDEDEEDEEDEDEEDEDDSDD